MKNEEKLRELRDSRTQAIISSGKKKIPRSSLVRKPLWLEDTRTGEFFHVEPDANPNASHCPAYFVADDGSAFLLRRADPANRDEAAQRRAESGARRAASEAGRKELRTQIFEAEIAERLAERERVARVRAGLA